MTTLSPDTAATRLRSGLSRSNGCLQTIRSPFTGERHRYTARLTTIRSPGANVGSMLHPSTTYRETGAIAPSPPPTPRSSPSPRPSRSGSVGGDDQLSADRLVRRLPLHRDALGVPEDLGEPLHLSH